MPEVTAEKAGVLLETLEEKTQNTFRRMITPDPKNYGQDVRARADTIYSFNAKEINTIESQVPWSKESVRDLYAQIITLLRSEIAKGKDQNKWTEAERLGVELTVMERAMAVVDGTRHGPDSIINSLGHLRQYGQETITRDVTNLERSYKEKKPEYENIFGVQRKGRTKNYREFSERRLEGLLSFIGSNADAWSAGNT